MSEQDETISPKALENFGLVQAMQYRWNKEKTEREERTAKEQNTLRDQFAMAALTGIVACYRDHEGAETIPDRCKKAYEYADAMLKARAK
jgi:hypothetical protein